MAMSRHILGVVALGASVIVAAPLSGARNRFAPDWTFKGSTLAGWHVLGQADWRAADGELIGTPKAPEGGWLVLDKSFQDVQFGADFRCTAGCKTGVLLRAEKTPNGMKGIYMSLVEGDVAGYAVTLDASGRELTRERLRPGGGEGRFAPTVAQAAATAAARGGGGGAAAGGGRGAATGAQAGAGGRAGGGGGGRGALAAGVPVSTANTAYRPNDWNDVELIIDTNALRPYLNTGLIGGGASDEDLASFGPIALYVGGSGEVRFRDVAYKDVAPKTFVKEQVSPNFRMQRLNPLHYAWSAAAADFNRDGNMDIVSGPFIYLGPDYTKALEIYGAESVNPSTQYPTLSMVAFAGDFTGDGWPDVLVTFDRPRLYVNPQGESRRWTSYPNVIAGATEVSVLKDVDGDGKPEIVHGTAGAVWYSKPDPANPTGPWISTQVSETGTSASHGMGVGDINGDGRMDILNVYGWWEQPAKGTPPGLWKYHPQAFGKMSGTLPGGGEMGVYDVNGDGLTDVVTGLAAHGFGLAWFEQKRAPAPSGAGGNSAGAISFVQHMIGDYFSTKNAGNVTFTEPHGSTSADVDGDGIPDFIVGKRYWSHKESFSVPDPYGPAVLYVYLTRRNPRVPGGAELVPELLHNQSGAGSQVLAVDLNKDGVVDVVTSTRFGTFAFFGKPRPATRRSSAR